MDNNGIISTVLPTYRYKVGDEFNFLLLSDLHLGAASTNEKSIKDKWLEWALENNARININGDVLDAIIHKDPRFLPSVVKKSLRGEDKLLNALTNYVFEFLKPYAHLIDVIGEGNHENVLHGHTGYDPLKGAIGLLNMLPDVKIVHGNFSGFITYRFEHNAGGRCVPYRMFYKHGGGGNSPVTKGVIQHNRELAALENVDLIWLGHTHTKYSMSDVKYGVNSKGTIYFREVKCVRTGAFMDHIDNSYQVRKGLPPQPHGGARVKLVMKAGEFTQWITQ